MTTTVAPPTDAPKGRAERPGPSGVPTGVLVGIAVVLLAVMAWGVNALVAKPTVNYADPSSWLPKQQLDHPVDQTIAGSVGHPGLTENGGYVQVTTPTFSALAVVSGPVVPGEGLPVVQRYTTCTWTVSIDHVQGTVPVSLADFDTIDHRQTVYSLSMVPGQQPLPTTLRAGQSLTFKVRAVMPTGEGLLRWAPDGNDIVAKWDYHVEND